MIDLISLMFLISGTILLTITLIVLIILIRKYWGEVKRIMYELLIRLYYELDYKKYDIEDLKEIKDILNGFNGRTEEVKLKRVKEKGEMKNDKRSNN